MIGRLVALVALCTACSASIITQPDSGGYPACASLGCPAEPSGTPETWSPCTDDLCWCGSPAKRCARDRWNQDAPLGAVCDVVLSYYCAAGIGVCAHGTCRAQCQADAYYRCPVDQHERIEDLGHGPQCYCSNQ